MHSTRRPSMLLAAALLVFAALWVACPPPPPPPPPGDTTTVSKLGRSEEGMGDLLPDGGVGRAFRGPDGGIVTPQSVSWCMYSVTGPAGGAACFGKQSHICIMCSEKGCPQSLAGAIVPNMPQSGNPGKMGCDIKIGGSPNAWTCGTCDSSDDDSIGGLGPFGGYFHF